MPLARLELRNEYGLGGPELYRNAASGKEDAEAILHGVAVAGLVGILRQLGDVAEFGAEIFHNLHEQVMSTSARGQKMLSRIKEIEDALPSIEDSVHRKESYIDLAYETGSGWHADLSIMDTHLSWDDLPQFIMDSYEDCRDPPCLYLLDKYDRAGNGACLKRYSDPSYFKKAWANSEPEKAQQIQNEKKHQIFKRKYSRLREEIQDPEPTSQCNRLESSARFAPLSNDDNCFSAENSSQPLNTMNKLNCTGQVSETNHSVMHNAPEYDRFSVSNTQNNHDHTGASLLHNDELVFDVDNDSQDDFLHWKITSWSPSVTWDEKSELVKTVGLKFSDGTQDSKPFFVNSESSSVEEPTRTGSLNRAKPSSIIADLPRLPCDKNEFEEVNETDNYVDALNTLESEVETDSECPTKCMQSLSDMEHQKNESGVASMAQYHSHSKNEVPMSVHDSSNKYRVPSDTNFDASRMLEVMQSTLETDLSPGAAYDGGQIFESSVPTMSITNTLHGTDDDQHPWSINAKSESVLNRETIAATSPIQTSPPVSISNIPSSKLWTNGNLLGLEPSKPVDLNLPNGTGAMSQSNNLNSSVKSEKQNMAIGQISKQLKSDGNVQGSTESLNFTDEAILNSNPALSRKYLVDENSSLEAYSTCIGHNNDGSGIQQNPQEQFVSLSFSEHEGSQVASPNVLTTMISQVHQTTKRPSSKVSEPCGPFSAASLSTDSVQNRKCLSPSFSGLTQRNLVQCLHIKPSLSNAKSSAQQEPVNIDSNQSEEKPLVDNQRKRFNEVASQTLHEQSLINKTDYGSLEYPLSSTSHYSQNSSPPLEHMKISFHPMNSIAASNLKVELPDGYINQRIDANMPPPLHLFSGCNLPSQDSASESDDTFCKSNPYSTEDLLSACSDSNSELWEQDEYSEIQTNELSDDFRRISSSTETNSSQMNHQDICCGNDTDSFLPHYTSNIPTFESLMNQDVRYESFSVSPTNATTLMPTELPPPPPLPPIQWRLTRPSYEISGDNYSDLTQMVNHFEYSQNQNLPAPMEIENSIQLTMHLRVDGQHKQLQDNQKTCELDGRKQWLRQIRDPEIPHNLEPCKESKSQIASGEGVYETGDLLHQIRTKTFNLRRAATSRPSFVTQPTSNDRVTAILEKANAIRQACASSDEDDNDVDWSDN
ncbi:protein SCAR3 isoform X2 [Phalaenopsis equestris]|uniref:protein SCAR3 isoform X2 n=1 Tax=Phalaenopsis equestris TaxID=78828 RepID=UPI0009E32668|nr:protein SCAR3 isoform X2 [Phalaenopsis equestris]